MKSPSATAQTTPTKTTQPTTTHLKLEIPKPTHERNPLAESPTSRTISQPHKNSRYSDKMSANTLTLPAATVTTTKTAKTKMTANRPDINFILGGDTTATQPQGLEVTVPQQLLKLVTQSPRKLSGISRSQDDDDEEARSRQDVEELLEQRFGSVSPIFPDHTSSRHGSMSSVGATRATNFRQKFRKSHTCGSLFANCNCSANSAAAPIPLQTGTLTREVSYERRQPLAALPKSVHLSLSPSSAEASISSGIGASLISNSAASSSRWLSGGSFSLSTTTTTSAQLSRDDDVEDFGAVDDSSYAWSSLVGESHANSAHATSRKPQISTQRSGESRISSPPTFEVPTITTSGSLTSLSSVSTGAQRKSKRLFQSYSHPDTNFIFTDENKKPSRESIVISPPAAVDAVLTSRDGHIAVKHTKRSSSPNIGQYQTLDVAVHPDLLVKISPRHSPLLGEQRKQASGSATYSARSTQHRRRWLQRSKEIESGGSTTDSEPSFDVQSPPALPTIVSNDSPPEELKPIEPKSPTKSVKEESVAVKTQSGAEHKILNAAERYFAESGILGPISAPSTLIRKTSKILQDSNVIEKIRKTSMILRKNSSATTPQRNSSSTSPPITTLTPPPQPPRTLNLYNDNMELPATIVYANKSKPQSPKSPKSPHTIATTCGFSPNLTTQSSSILDDRDALIKSVQGEVVSLKDVIKSRDAEIVKLRREIHKLKSVLQQTTNHIPLAHDELLQSPLIEHKPFWELPQQCAEVTSSETAKRQQICLHCRRKFDAGPNNSSGNTSESNGSASLDSTISEYYSANSNANGGTAVSKTDKNGSNTNNSAAIASTNAASCALDAASNSSQSSAEALNVVANAAATTTAACGESLPNSAAAKTKIAHLNIAPVLKKQGVSGESCETSMQQSINVPIPKYDKDFSSKQLIKDAIMDNDFLKNIDSSQVRELVESMYSLSVAKGEFVIREGEVGAHLYVSAEGEFEVVKNGKVLGIMGPGKAFGELAILYNCTRTASIRVLSDARVWVLDRRVFQQIMMRTGMQRIENSVKFLKSVPLLKNLSEEVLAKIADVLEVEFYPAGTYIIRQGASGDTFFLISQGSVQVTQKLGSSSVEKEIRTLERGDYFGEQALINEDKRTANIIALAPGVECLTLDRDSFTHLIGDLCELKEKNYGDENRVLAMKYAETKEIFGANIQQEFPDMKLTDLEVVTTLGIGGFGRVELVKAYQENRIDFFALKCLKKRHIVDTKQEEHVFSERTIMLSCKTPFICRLFRTFRDEKYVYMMLEACMGGEIWTMLRDRGSFDENAAQFIIGCVLQAFEYLHSRGIIYRDLKPENLMLDERGYVKLVDFGFAKYIGNSSKTWTFCGTPEYVAPEIILNKGHDRAVDYWALGILIHELLNGTPPFTSNDPMKTYNIILKGIDMIDFPKHMTRSAVQLIKKLCRDVPAERLGYQKGGIQDIKKHKWFLGFDWDGLQSQLLIPPFVRPIAHPSDTCYFDRFPYDPTEPPEECSGWDIDF